MSTKDQDAFTEASLNTRITDLYALYNDLTADDVDRAALNREHLPKLTTVLGAEFSDLTVAGGHGASDDLGAEQYDGETFEDTTSSIPYPRFTTNPMRSAGTNAPYGASGANDGWSIIARNNSSSDCAEIGTSIAVTTGLFADGTLEVKIDGWVELAYLDEGLRSTILGAGNEPNLSSPILGIGVEINHSGVGTRRYILPRSIRIYGPDMNKDTLHSRVVLNATTLAEASIVSGTATIEAIFLAFTTAKSRTGTAGGAYTTDDWYLGTWMLSIEPVIRDDF